MADFTNEQLERSLFPDGCQPGRVATSGGDHQVDLAALILAGLDDDGDASPLATIEQVGESLQPREANAAKPEPIPAALAQFRALRAAAARQKEERREAAKLAKTREQARIRKQRQRAKDRAAVTIDTTAAPDHLLADLEPAPCREFQATGWARQYDQRLAALSNATANAMGDAFLIQMKGREIELVQGWVARQRARESFGRKASLSQIAVQAHMTKSSAQKLVKNIAKLEERGRPWHGMQPSNSSESP